MTFSRRSLQPLPYGNFPVVFSGRWIHIISIDSLHFEVSSYRIIFMHLRIFANRLILIIKNIWLTDKELEK